MRIFLGMPHNGRIEAGAAQALWCPSSRATAVKVACVENSLLPSAFNDLLCVALNERDAGRVTHFAMLHSDVLPRGPWLDVLASEMTLAGADMVSAVVAIKEDDPDPSTSTAIGDSTDRWRVKRCLRLSDQAWLPPTFGPEHCCRQDEVLLLNTGLWLTDLRHPAWDVFPGFQLHNRIMRDAVTGEWTSQQRSEDWELSHHMHEHGARCVATWRVPVSHRGPRSWPNTLKG